MNTCISSQKLSYFSLSFLQSDFNLSATFLTICLEILLTSLSFCKKLLDTLSGKSGQSITPFNNNRNYGITSLILSSTNTWLLYNLTLPSTNSNSFFSLGKYKIPFKLNG